MANFRELLKVSIKSEDTEEWLDVYFTRPIGLVFALFWNKLGVHPNAITILSIFLGVAAGWMFHYTDLLHNLYGVILLMLANFCDSTDGQMARLTGKKTLVGRVLDGFSGDLWLRVSMLVLWSACGRSTFQEQIFRGESLDSSWLLWQGLAVTPAKVHWLIIIGKYTSFSF